MEFSRLFLLLVLELAVLLHGNEATAYDHVINLDKSSPNAHDNTTCGNQTQPCLSLTYALSKRVLDSTQLVVIDSGEYSLNEVISISHFSNIAVIGVPQLLRESSQPTVTVTVTCASGAGLSFVYCSNITLQNILFSGCGAVQTSTSRNFSSLQFSFMEFPVGLYFLFCQHTNLTQVTITNSSGTGVSMYATGGLNHIHNCSFLHNRPPMDQMVPGGGGLFIEFPFCDPQAPEECDNGTTIIPHQFRAGVEYKISECKFEANFGHMWHPVEYLYLLPQDKQHLTFGHGGGLSVFFSHADNSSVIVEHCRFENNEAEWGGGVFVAFQKQSSSNTFSIYHSLVRNNTSFFKKSSFSTQTTGGGGMRVEFTFINDSEVNNNSVVLDSVQFQQNRAYWGGGVSFTTGLESKTGVATNSLKFRNTTWDSNSAKTGSAVDLSIWNRGSAGAVLTPIFTDCTFINNNNENSMYDNVGEDLVGVGTFYSSYVPVIFDRSAIFEDNTLSALAAVGTSLNFLHHCNATFNRNSGKIGGAISLFGSAYIQVHHNTNMHFVNNSASQYGGAIHSYAIGQHTIATFGNCFIQYEDVQTEPWNWTSRFYFKGNTANFNGGKNSISAISLHPCLWDYYSVHPSTDVPSPSKQIFCWNDNWVYADGSCQDEISSAPASFNTSRNNSRYMELFLGRPHSIPVEVLDDKGINVNERVVYTANSLTPDVVEVSNNSLYISDNLLNLVGIPNTTGRIQLNTLGPRVLSWDLEVNVLPCPPGFTLQTNFNSSLAQCVCDGNYEEKVKCDEASFTAELQRGNWMGVDSSDPSGQLLVGISPYTASAMDTQYVQLTNRSSQLNQLLCEPIGREGILCGRCLDGYGLAVNTKQVQCVPCTHQQAYYMWVFYILCQLVPITIMFLIFLLLNVSTTTGPANAFILFAQLLTTTFNIEGDETVHVKSITSHYDILQEIYTVPYDIWNLNFFFFTPSCLSPYLSTQTFLALDYLIAIYPLILIIIFYTTVSLYDRGTQPVYCLCRPLHNLFARFQHQWNLQHSTIDTFATFLVLSYNKFTVTSVYLLTTNPLLDSSGTTVANVLYLDGNVHFLSVEHLPFFILALFVLLIVVALPPFLLLVYPLRLLNKITSTLCCKSNCFKVSTGGRIQIFLETFQGCFKDGTDGTKDYRFFAGVYFILRILYFTVYAYTASWMQQYFLQQLLCTVIILLFAIVRPYKKEFYNNLDAVIFGMLAIINAVSIYNIFYTSLDLPLSKWAFTLQYVVIFCPLIYMVVYVIQAVVKNNAPLFKKCWSKHISNSTSVNEDTSLLSDHQIGGPRNLDAEFLAFATVLDSEDHQVNRYTPPESTSAEENDGDMQLVEPGNLGLSGSGDDK